MVLLFFGCSQKTIQDVPSRLTEVETQLRTSLDQLIQWRNATNIQGRALTPKERDFVRDVNALETDYLGWQALKKPQTSRAWRRHLQALEALRTRAAALTERSIPVKEERY